MKIVSESFSRVSIFFYLLFFKSICNEFLVYLWVVVELKGKKIEKEKVERNIRFTGK